MPLPLIAYGIVLAGSALLVACGGGEQEKKSLAEPRFRNKEDGGADGAVVTRPDGSVEPLYPDGGVGRPDGSVEPLFPDAGDGGYTGDSGYTGDAGVYQDAGGRTDAGSAVDAGDAGCVQRCYFNSDGSLDHCDICIDVIEPDGGSAGGDAGVAADAGSCADAGSLAADAGHTPDGGSVAHDAGATFSDAGSPVDAGSLADAGSSVDGGSDGGTQIVYGDSYNCSVNYMPLGYGMSMESEGRSILTANGFVSNMIFKAAPGTESELERIRQEEAAGVDNWAKDGQTVEAGARNLTGRWNLEVAEGTAVLNNYDVFGVQRDATLLPMTYCMDADCTGDVESIDPMTTNETYYSQDGAMEFPVVWSEDGASFSGEYLIGGDTNIGLTCSKAN